MFFVIFLVALLFSAVGFKKYIWFISIGYGLAIAGIGGVLLIAFHGVHTGATVFYCVLFVIYGLRLAGYLAFRETSRSSYGEKMKGEIKESDSVSMVEKVAIWISASLLYACEAAPLLFRLQEMKAEAAHTDFVLVIGIIISLAGIVIEAVADMQKASYKKTNPYHFVSSGLFSFVRCPNYFGELLMWTGVFISGLTVSHGGWRWLAVLAGFIGIIYIMFSGARRLELRQERTYGKDPEYRRYVNTTPILIPFVPIYSVKTHRWLVG